MNLNNFLILTGVLGFFNLLFLFYYFKLRGYCQELLYFKDAYEGFLLKIKKENEIKKETELAEEVKKVKILLKKKDTIMIGDCIYFKTKKQNGGHFYYKVGADVCKKTSYLGSDD